MLSLARVIAAPMRWSATRAQVRGKRKKAVSQVSDADAGVDVDLSQYSASMGRTVENLQRDLAAMRTSGAHPGILDSASFLS
jgi:hypothetical protein